MTFDVEQAVKILLVSGGPSLTRQVSAALPEDADVLEVRTPQRGLAVIDEGAQVFDVVVGDADTHPTGGFYLVREMRARMTDGRDLPPVVLLIARPQDEYLSRWAQADAWVVKPIDPFDLAEVLDALVDGVDVPALPGVGTLGHAPRLGPGGGTNADRTSLGGRPPAHALRGDITTPAITPSGGMAPDDPTRDRDDPTENRDDQTRDPVDSTRDPDEPTAMPDDPAATMPTDA